MAYIKCCQCSQCEKDDVNCLIIDNTNVEDEEFFELSICIDCLNQCIYEMISPDTVVRGD